MGVNFFISKKCAKPSTIHNVGNIKKSTQCKKNTQDNVEVYILVKEHENNCNHFKNHEFLQALNLNYLSTYNVF